MTWISAGKIIDKAASLRIAPIRVMCQDPLYGALTPSDVTVNLANSARQVFGSVGVEYSGAIDCNGFSGIVASIARLIMIKTTKEVPPAFGTFAYWSDKLNGGHSINVAVHWVGSDIEFKFYEPQQGLRAMSLTAQEIASCIEMRFA